MEVSEYSLCKESCKPGRMCTGHNQEHHASTRRGFLTVSMTYLWLVLSGVYAQFYNGWSQTGDH